MGSGAHQRRTRSPKSSTSSLLTQVPETKGADPGEDEPNRAWGLSCTPWVQVVSQGWDSKMQDNQEVKQQQKEKGNPKVCEKNLTHMVGRDRNRGTNRSPQTQQFETCLLSHFLRSGQGLFTWLNPRCWPGCAPFWRPGSTSKLTWLLAKFSSLQLQDCGPRFLANWRSSARGCPQLRVASLSSCTRWRLVFSGQQDDLSCAWSLTSGRTLSRAQ